MCVEGGLTYLMASNKMAAVQLTAIDKNESYSQKVYIQLKQLILTNQIKSGQILNERELADQLAVSRTPIRDALKMLEQEGWVVKEGKFKVVRLLTWKSVQDLIEIRRPLEVMSYQLACKKITDEDIEALSQICDEMKAIGQQGDDAYYEAMAADIEFHIQIARITRNEKVIRMMSDLGDELIRTAVLSVMYGDLDVDRYRFNHDRLLEHIKNRNFDVGLEELNKHISTWEGHLEKVPLSLRIHEGKNLIL